MSVTIVPVSDSYRAGWQRLFRGYATFYQRTLTDETMVRVWQWLHDPDHVLEGVLALREGEAVGLAHFRAMPNPLRGCDIGFLDDLFVDPALRGTGAGRALLDHVAGIARQRGWPLVRWLTGDDNYRARILYDRVGRKALWNVYELDAG